MCSLRLYLKYFNKSFIEADVCDMFYIETVRVTALYIANAAKLNNNLYELFACVPSGIKLLYLWKGKEAQFSFQQIVHIVRPSSRYTCKVLEMHLRSAPFLSS